jgi:hypothetical protein
MKDSINLGGPRLDVELHLAERAGVRAYKFRYNQGYIPKAETEPRNQGSHERCGVNSIAVQKRSWRMYASDLVTISYFPDKDLASWPPSQFEQ